MPCQTLSIPVTVNLSEITSHCLSDPEHVHVFRDPESGCLVCNGSRERPDVTCYRPTTRMATSSTRGSGAMDVGLLASGPLTCQQRAEVDLRTNQTSYRAAVPGGASSGIHMFLEMRERDKSKLRDKGILTAVVTIIDVIEHDLLGMDVWKQSEIDCTMAETLDETKNEWCWSRANSSANATLAMSMTLCRARAACKVCLSTRTSRNPQASPPTGL